MRPSRRELLAAGIAAVACPSEASAVQPLRAAARTRREVDPWSDLRSGFELDPDRIHLAGLLIASHPAPVRAAIDRHRRALDANPGRYLPDNNSRLLGEVRAAAGRYLGVEPAEIALTDSTTMGLALVYTALRIRSDQEVVTAERDYFVTHASVANLARRTGCSVRRIALYDDIHAVTEDEIVDSVVAAIRPETRLVTATWVHSATGLKVPVRRIADHLAEVNTDRAEADRILLGVDGAHGLGVEPEGARDLGCDFLMAGTHKWLFGPRGTGVLWGHPRAHGEVTPTIPSFTSAVGWGGEMSPGGFKAFEHQWAVADAFALHLELGKQAVAERTRALARRLKEGLAALERVTVITPMDERVSAGIVCFEVRGRTPDAVVAGLGERGVVASATPYWPSYTRMTPMVFNTDRDVEQAIRAVAEL